MSTLDGRAEGARVLGADDTAHGKVELWAWMAFGLLALALCGVVFLGARPGGRAPIWFWLHGRFLLVGAAFLLSLVGLGWSAWRRPFSQRRRVRAFVSLALVVGILPLPMPYPTSKELTPSRLPFALPLEGDWAVYQSGTEGGPLSAMTADRRFGLHLVHPEDLTRVRAGEGAAGFAGHGAVVQAPAAGVIAWVRDGLPDRSLSECTRPGPPELGNVVVIAVGEEQFLFLSHLQEGSLLVAAGDEVRKGQPLARIGFSGHFRFTPLPNLSIHLQSTPVEGWGEAVPWTFRGYLVGDRAIASGMPSQGVVIRRDG